MEIGITPMRVVKEKVFDALHWIQNKSVFTT